jgi:hypothetical protein
MKLFIASAIRLRAFTHQKDTRKRVKRQITNQEKFLAYKLSLND